MLVVAIRGAAAGRDAATVRLTGALTARGRRVAVIAACAGPLGIDEPGKDSYEHAAAGARDVLTVSAPRWARVHRNPAPAPPCLADLAPLVREAEVVFALGFDEPIRPCLVVEEGAGEGGAPRVRALTDGGGAQAFRLDKPDAIADLIERLSEETR